MDHRTRLSVSLLLALCLLALMGLAACTREKPAPTASWLGTTPTAFLGQPATTPGALQSPVAVAATSTPQVVPTATPAPGSPTQVVPTARVIVPTPAPHTPGTEEETEAEGQPEASEGTFIYTVDPGDTLFSIATHYGTSVAVLVELNDLADAESITVGQVLEIPLGAPAQVPGEEPVEEPTEAPAAIVHVVQQGETLYSICQLYGAEMYAVMEANGLTDSNFLYVGQELIISGAAAPEMPETPETTEQQVYIVQSGDRLVDIAPIRT
jgi:LysM repeat protein